MIKKLRQKKKLSQLELAQLLGVSRTTISMWENNNSQPTYDNLQKLALVLDTEIFALVDSFAKSKFINNYDEK